MIKYQLPWPAYAADWAPTSSSFDGDDPFALIALASFMPTKKNDLLVLNVHDPTNTVINAPPVKVIGSMAYRMAATKAAFCPQRRADGVDLLALCGADVTLVQVGKNGADAVGILSSAAALKRNSIASDGVILPSGNANGNPANGHDGNSPAPITSLNWSATDPNLLITASYDTTCTIWNVETGSIRTQLIAHDKEVFDVSFSPVRSDTFVSVGAEGSLRLFDTRYAVHSIV